MKAHSLLFCALTSIAASAYLSHAQAHGTAKPIHGGIIQTVSDSSFELVADKDRISIYLMDHDKPIASQSVTGRIVVMQGSKTSELSLQSGGGNRLNAQGLQLSKGDKVVATLNNVSGKNITVRFSLR